MEYFYIAVLVLLLKGSKYVFHHCFTILNHNNNNKDAFVSISLRLSSRHPPLSVSHLIRPSTRPEGSTVVSGFPDPPPSILTMGQDTCQYQGQLQIQPPLYSRWVRTHVNTRDNYRYNLIYTRNYRHKKISHAYLSV